MHSVISAPVQPSGGASVDEYECVQNEISYETTYYAVVTVFLLLNTLFWTVLSRT